MPTSLLHKLKYQKLISNSMCHFGWVYKSREMLGQEIEGKSSRPSSWAGFITIFNLFAYQHSSTSYQLFQLKLNFVELSSSWIIVEMLCWFWLIQSLSSTLMPRSILSSLVNIDSAHYVNSWQRWFNRNLPICACWVIHDE